MAAFLQNTSELPYFHFNEALFKPFENLICLELCDSDVQDQIVTSICDFVETNTAEISSGWRSLFGCLKSVHFPIELRDPEAATATASTSSPIKAATTHESHWRAVQDVFEAFLATESPQVFANAALDYVSCLLRRVRGSEERQQLEELISIRDVDRYLADGSADLTQAALQYLVRVHDILRRMHRMTSCPVFQGAHRIHLLPRPCVVDPVIPDFELSSFDAATDTLPDFPYSYKSLQTSDLVAEEDNHVLEDNNRGLFRVWYLLFDGLTSAVVNCPRGKQAAAVDTLFEIFNSIQKQVRRSLLIYFG